MNFRVVEQRGLENARSPFRVNGTPVVVSSSRLHAKVRSAPSARSQAVPSCKVAVARPAPASPAGPVE
jgi:hypothetical protein